MGHCFRGRRRVRVMAEVKNSPSKVCRSRSSGLARSAKRLIRRGIIERGIPLRDFSFVEDEASDARLAFISVPETVESVPIEQSSRCFYLNGSSRGRMENRSFYSPIVESRLPAVGCTKTYKGILKHE